MIGGVHIELCVRLEPLGSLSLPSTGSLWKRNPMNEVLFRAFLLVAIVHKWLLFCCIETCVRLHNTSCRPLFAFWWAIYNKHLIRNPKAKQKKIDQSWKAGVNCIWGALRMHKDLGQARNAPVSTTLFGRLAQTAVVYRLRVTLIDSNLEDIWGTEESCIGTFHVPIPAIPIVWWVAPSGL